MVVNQLNGNELPKLGGRLERTGVKNLSNKRNNNVLNGISRCARRMFTPGAFGMCSRSECTAVTCALLASVRANSFFLQVPNLARLHKRRRKIRAPTEREQKWGWGWSACTVLYPLPFFFGGCQRSFHTDVRRGPEVLTLGVD